MMHWIRRRLGSAMLWGYGCLVGAFLLAPLVVLVSISFSSVALLTFPPIGFSLRWYGAAIRVPQLIEAFILSSELAVLASVVSTILGTMASLGMARRTFPCKQLVTSFFLSPLVFPSIVVGVALLQFYRTVRFEHVFTTLLLGHIVVTIPYTVRTVTASLEVFDYTLLDAARVLGANTLRTFLEVTLPIIKPGVFSGGIFAFLISFDNYTISMFLTDAKNITLPIRIYNYSEFAIDPTVAAVSSIMIVVSVLMFVVAGRLIGVREMARL